MTTHKTEFTTDETLPLNQYNSNAVVQDRLSEVTDTYVTENRRRLPKNFLMNRTKNIRSHTQINRTENIRLHTKINRTENIRSHTDKQDRKHKITHTSCSTFTTSYSVDLKNIGKWHWSHILHQSCPCQN